MKEVRDYGTMGEAELAVMEVTQSKIAKMENMSRDRLEKMKCAYHRNDDA